MKNQYFDSEIFLRPKLLIYISFSTLDHFGIICIPLQPTRFDFPN